MALFAGNVLPHRDFNYRAIPPPVRRKPVHDAAQKPIERHHQHRYPGAPRCPAVRAISPVGDRRARHHLDSRRSRSNAGRRAVRRAQAELGFGVEQCADRPCRKLLSRRRRARRGLLRLADRSARTQEAVHDHARHLSVGDRGHRPVMGRVELRRVPLSHRRRHRRRIHRHQFDNPGAYSGTVPRLDRPPHQRQLLAWRGNGRGRFARFARSGIHRSGDRLAAGVPDRRNNRTCYFGHATLDSGKPALAGDARLPAGGARGRPRHRSAICARQRCARARAAKSAAAHARPHAAPRGRPHAVRNLSPAHPGRPYA